MNEMVSEWTTYRTRFLIKARQLDAPLTFVDCLGREHSGQKGDYLVLSSDGSRRIAPREIFEDIYVPMKEADDWPASAANPGHSQPEQRVSSARTSAQTAVQRAPESTRMSSQSVLDHHGSARLPQSSQIRSQHAVDRRSTAQVCLA